MQNTLRHTMQKRATTSPSQAGTVLAVFLCFCPVFPPAPRHPGPLPRTTPQNHRGSLLLHITSHHTNCQFKSCQMREQIIHTGISHYVGNQMFTRVSYNHTPCPQICSTPRKQDIEQATRNWKTSHRNSPAPHHTSATHRAGYIPYTLDSKG